jgi:hypothetical protein
MAPDVPLLEVRLFATAPGKRPVAMVGRAEIPAGDLGGAFDHLMPEFVAALRERVLGTTATGDRHD